MYREAGGSASLVQSGPSSRPTLETIPHRLDELGARLGKLIERTSVVADFVGGSEPQPGLEKDGGRLPVNGIADDAHRRIDALFVLEEQLEYQIERFERTTRN